MRKWRGLALFLVVLMILEGFSVMASSSPVTDLAKFTDEVAKRYIGTEDPWALISLTQLGYRHANVKALEKKLRETVAPGTASSSGAAEGHGAAEYAKAIMGLASLGKNAKKEATAMLAIENITYAGDAANALLALDAIGYKTGKKNLWDREKLINMLLNQQVIMGGWGYYGVFDIDTTAMVLSALKRYTDRDGVTEAINLAVKRLSSAQEKDGGFISFGVVNSVSEAQAVVALSTLGIDAGADPQFVKDASLMSHFLS